MITYYKIVKLRNMYVPDLQCRRQAEILEGAYDTIIDAQCAIDDLQDAIYITDNGEAGAPEYIILEDVDADYISSGRGGDYSNYEWDGCTCGKGRENNPCGECDACIQCMINQDVKYCQDNAIKITI